MVTYFKIKPVFRSTGKVLESGCSLQLVCSSCFIVRNADLMRNKVHEKLTSNLLGIRRE